jgi:hypothetical protein
VISQPSIDFTPPPIHGATFDESLDYDRLNRQQRLVYAVMADGQWRTLAEIHTLTGAPEASVSARLRDLRRVAGAAVDRRRRGDPKLGLHEYRLVLVHAGA